MLSLWVEGRDISEMKTSINLANKIGFDRTVAFEEALSENPL